VSVGLGGAVPGLFAIISQVVPQRLQYRIQGLIWACFPLGVLSGGVVNGWILNHGHWQTIFIVGGVAPLLVALALWSIGPASEKSENATRRNALFAAAPILKGLWLRVALTGAIFFFSNGAIAVVMNWTPSLLVHAGYTAAVGAHALSWNAAGALISMMLTGFIVERSKIVPIVFGLIASTVVIVLISLFIHSLLLVTLLLVVLGSVLGLSGTAAVFLAGTLFPGGHQASGIGLCMAIGRGGQMIFPAVIGLLLQAGNSPSTTLLLIAILPAGGALAASALALQPRSRSAGR
jgi:AAHS family 3-hydroxyphenylpropionic acid transporter